MTWDDLTDDGAIKCSFLNIDKKILRGVCEEIESYGHEQNDQDVTTGIMTRYNVKTPNLLKLQEIIYKNLPFKRSRSINLWGNILTGLEYIRPHTHKSNKAGNQKQYKTFVFYPSVPKGSGALYFSEYNLEIVPQENQIVLWDCDILHEVYSNENPDIQRFSVTGFLKSDNV